MQDTKYYVALTRCSTEEQRKKGASHESQLREITNHSRFDNFNLVKSYSETISGWKNVNRDTLDRIFQFCLQNSKINYLIVQKWDRFYRNSQKALYWIEKFKEIGVQVNAAEQWINYEGGSINTILGIYIGMAADESHNTSMRVKDRNRVWQAKGYWLHDAPYGYYRDIKNLDENGKSTIKKKAETEYAVNMIFDLLKQQVLAPHEIRKKVIAEGYKIPSSVFYRLIKNIFYAGHLYLKAYKKESEKVIKSRYPAYITLEQFYKNQTYIEQIKQKGGRKTTTNNNQSIELFPLKGHIKCNICNKNLTASKSKGKKKKYGYYHHNGCRVRIASKQAEQVICNVLQSFELEDEYYDMLQLYIAKELKTMTMDLRNRMKPLEAALTKNDKRLSKLKFLLTDDEISIEEYRTIKSQIQKDRVEKEVELKRIKKRLTNVDNETDSILKLLRNLQAIYFSCDNPHKRLLLDTIFPKGFTIEKVKVEQKTSYRCRTPKINDLLDILCWNSVGYHKQKTELLEVVPCRTRNDTKIEQEKDIISLFKEWQPLLNALNAA